jgi:LPXTG-motif cell wall-anchored protein
MFMIKKALGIVFAIALFGFVWAPAARADDWNKETKITFSQPVDVAGHVLVAGTYIFKMADANDRHIVQIFSADGKRLIATVMTIPDYRLKATDETVIRFREVPAGSPEAVRAWFYPGRTNGEEFVYPKRRAIELARVAKVAVPAIAVDTIDVADVAALKTAPIVAVTPEEKEVPVQVAIQTTPAPSVGTVARNEPRELPKTSSSLPLLILLGVTFLGLGAGFMVFGQRYAHAAQ